MKTLLLLRHAKSDWSADYTGDHERPLNKRGRRAAASVGKFLRNTDMVPPLVISSSSVRTTETVRLAREAGGWDSEVVFKRSFYLADVDVMLDEVRRQDDDLDLIMTVGHQPTMESLLHVLVGGGAHRYPTAALARIDFEVGSWDAVGPDSGQLIMLLPPALIP